MMELDRGLVLGKFMPPHAGHLFLCDFARRSCARLTILVCSLPDDRIPGANRLAWMREMFGNCRVVWCDEVAPQTPDEHPDFWTIWRDLITRRVGPVDAVFASEAYGNRLAAELGAAFVPCDPGREAFPISATAIREDPVAQWRFIPPAVRPWFLKRVCVFGPESSGKTTLAQGLARAFATVWVPEYGRAYTDALGTNITAEDLAAIRAGQEASRAAAAGQSGPVLIEDTDPILTCVWSDMLLGGRSDWMAEVLAPADLYLLTDIDFPWVDDGTRYFPDQDDRRRFFAACEDELKRRHLPYAVVSGSPEQRLALATSLVEERFGVGSAD